MARMRQSDKRTGRKTGVDSWALFEAEAAYADSMFRTAMGDVKEGLDALHRAIEIHPGYAPAIFSLGTVHYQRGNSADGRRLFHSLLACPADTPDLLDLIDHAGDFLIGLGAYEDGLDLYRAATLRFPEVAVLHQGAGCCAGHRGLHEEAVDASKRALELEPRNQTFVNDLGWSLVGAGRLLEAEETLARAVKMDPNDERARSNLRFCKESLAKWEATTNRTLRPTVPQRKNNSGG